MLANADRRAHIIIIMTMADDGWWCAYLCTYLYTVWFDDSKCTVECDDVGTFVGVVAEVDGRIQRLVSHRPILICNNVAVCWPFCSECTLTTAKHTHKCAKLCLTIFRVVHCCCWSPLVYIFVSFIFYIYVFNHCSKILFLFSHLCVEFNCGLAYVRYTQKSTRLRRSVGNLKRLCSARWQSVCQRSICTALRTRAQIEANDTHTHKMACILVGTFGYHPSECF